MRYRRRRAACAALLAATASLQGCPDGNGVSVTASSSTATVGQLVAFTVSMNFSDATLGGGFRIGYDPTRLRFLSFSWDNGLADDPFFRVVCPNPEEFRCNGIDTSNNVLLVYGNFNAPLQHSYIVGSIIFQTLQTGSASVSPVGDPDYTGPFVSSDTFDPLAVSYSGSTIRVN